MSGSAANWPVPVASVIDLAQVSAAPISRSERREVVRVDVCHSLPQDRFVTRWAHAHQRYGAAVTNFRLECRLQRVLVVGVHHGRCLAAFEVTVLVEQHLSLPAVLNAVREYQGV